jgi:hypothetical protein
MIYIAYWLLKTSIIVHLHEITLSQLVSIFPHSQNQVQHAFNISVFLT